MRKILESKGFSSVASSLIAIVVGLLFGFVILLISNPQQAVQGLGIIMAGGFTGGMKGLGQVLYFATPIIMTGLSVGFANKTGLFNIGAAGQFIVGAFAAVYVGVHWTFLPGATHWIVALLAAMVAGGIWGAVPGIFKALLNVNEVISSIMMNYIGMYGVNYLVKQTVYNQLKNESMTVAANAALPKAGLDGIFKNVIAGGKRLDISSVNAGILIAIAMAVVIYILVVDVIAAEGFNGIPVALLGMNNPIGIIFSGIFISYITLGGNYLQRLNYMPEIIDIIIAVIIYFSAFSLLVKQFIARTVQRREMHEEKEVK